MIQISENMEDYLKATKYMDYKSSKVSSLAKELVCNCATDTEKIQAIYLYVRDNIKHSWDIQSSQVSVTASDVLIVGHGICYAKSNLLAALLRSHGIPTGFCYQRLTLGDTPDTGYCIHALNAVYLKDLKKWLRLDARGNKEGVDAQFSIEGEKVAFPIRKEFDEIDYKDIYSEPLEITMKVLENSTDAIYMMLHSLPERL